MKVNFKGLMFYFVFFLSNFIPEIFKLLNQKVEVGFFPKWAFI